MTDTRRRLARSRRTQLKAMLEKRYRELGAQLKEALQERRAQEWTLRTSSEGVEELDPGDLGLAIAELKSDMRERVAAALARLAHGNYGRCETCGQEISTARLEAMPFALRCRACEAQREEDDRTHGAGRDPRWVARLSDYPHIH